jgi:hypothetical protein
LKRFGVDEPADDPALIGALLGHVRYRDHYTSGETEDLDPGPLHGPYRLDAITPEAYEPITEDQANATIGEFIDLSGGAPTKLHDEIAAGLNPLIRSARSRFRLRHLPDEARHEFGWVLWEFREVLFVGTDGKQLTLVVMAID